MHGHGFLKELILCFSLRAELLVCVCELETLDLLKELRSCLRPSSMLLPVVEIPEESWNRSQPR